MERKPYLYQHYTWPEMREVIKSQPVVILPIGSVEDHGRHLPIDTDNFLIWSICEAAAQDASGEILLLPQIPFGFETHHLDFPGTIDGPQPIRSAIPRPADVSTPLPVPAKCSAGKDSSYDSYTSFSISAGFCGSITSQSAAVMGARVP